MILLISPSHISVQRHQRLGLKVTGSIKETLNIIKCGLQHDIAPNTFDESDLSLVIPRTMPALPYSAALPSFPKRLSKSITCFRLATRRYYVRSTSKRHQISASGSSILTRRFITLDPRLPAVRGIASHAEPSYRAVLSTV